MSLKKTDRIIAPARGTAETVLDAISALYDGAGILWPEKAQQVIKFVKEVYRVAPMVGIDAALVVVQAAHETGTVIKGRWVPFTSRRFLDNGNSGGFLIEQDGDADPATFTGAEAARVHLWALLWACGIRRSVLAIQPIPDSADVLMDRWITKYADPACPTVVTLDDLNVRYTDRAGEPQATWAWDATYQDQLVDRARVLFPTLPDQTDVPSQPQSGGSNVPDLVFGKVPHPAYTNRTIPSSQNTAWNDLGKRTVRAVVWHRMLGSLGGTDTYFRNDGGDKALTDYGVGVAAQDGTALDGVIYQWNDPRGTRSPWANGKVSAPYGDGKAFVDRYGINAVNRDATAIEISGFQQTALSEKSRNAICAITAYWADQAKIPWTTFPAVPGESRSFVIWHQEFTIGTGKECPFAVVMGETDALIERTRAILKQYQTEAVTPAEEPKPVPTPLYETPAKPAWWDAAKKAAYPKVYAFGTDDKVRFIGLRSQMTVQRPTVQRATASVKSSKPCGPDLAKGTVVNVEGIFTVGSTKWVLASGAGSVADCARIPLNDLSLKVTVSERAA